MKKYYKPLPNNLTIKESKIHGLGLFATEFIPKGTNLGITHITDKNFEDGYIRTPLGGFFNHSDNPNIMIKKNELSYLEIITIKDIQKEEEITAEYTLYNPIN
jgi:SET domain-containing protein